MSHDDKNITNPKKPFMDFTPEEQVFFDEVKKLFIGTGTYATLSPMYKFGLGSLKMRLDRRDTVTLEDVQQTLQEFIAGWPARKMKEAIVNYPLTPATDENEVQQTLDKIRQEGEAEARTVDVQEVVKLAEKVGLKSRWPAIKPRSIF